MKKLIVILVPVIVVVAVALLVVIFVMPRAAAAPASAPAPAASGKLMGIESYLSQNISELSPVKETMGGKFYTTDVQVADGRGVVYYEDGHNAYVADFTYEVSDQTGIHITSFFIRE